MSEGVVSGQSRLAEYSERQPRIGCLGKSETEFTLKKMTAAGTLERAPHEKAAKMVEQHEGQSSREIRPHYKRRRKLIQELRKVMCNFQPAPESMALVLSSSAHHIQRLKEEQLDIVRMIEKLTAENATVQALREMRGIGTITAAPMIAEIIDITRFAHEDSLACYAD